MACQSKLVTKKNKKWSVAKGLHGEDATLQHCAERAYHALTY